MVRNVDMVEVDGAWLSIGGNTPFSIPDAYIEEILIINNDKDLSTALIEIKFENGNVLEVMTHEYKTLTKASK